MVKYQIYLLSELYDLQKTKFKRLTDALTGKLLNFFYGDIGPRVFYSVDIVEFL